MNSDIVAADSFYIYMVSHDLLLLRFEYLTTEENQERGQSSALFSLKQKYIITFLHPKPAIVQKQRHIDTFPHHEPEIFQIFRTKTASQQAKTNRRYYSRGQYYDCDICMRVKYREIQGKSPMTCDI